MKKIKAIGPNQFERRLVSDSVSGGGGGKKTSKIRTSNFFFFT